MTMMIVSLINALRTFLASSGAVVLDHEDVDVGDDDDDDDADLDAESPGLQAVAKDKPPVLQEK